MLITYSPTQQMHRPIHVIKKGRPSRSYDVPDRIDSILAAISKRRLGPIVPPTPADYEPIRAAHDSDMITYLETAYASENEANNTPEPLFPTFFPPPGQRRRPTRVYGQRGHYCTDTGAPLGPHTWQAARASAACAVAGARHILSGHRFAYALCRPPGHHAGPDFFGGYCYLNNAAVATHVLRHTGGRVAILDIDYHHGNGTQAFFQRDPKVWYGSLHIDPAIDYPFFAGYADETGEGPGEGTICNVPLQPETEQECYMKALEKLCEQALRFSPRWLILSAGFDTYVQDPIGTFHIDTEGYHEIGGMIGRLGLSTLVVQEGGYYLPDLGLNLAALLQGIEGTRASAC